MDVTFDAARLARLLALVLQTPYHSGKERT
jgi:hypothetical protein